MVVRITLSAFVFLFCGYMLGYITGSSSVNKYLAVQGCETAAFTIHHQLLKCERELIFLEEENRGW